MMNSCAVQNNSTQYNYGGGVYNDGSGGGATLSILNSIVSGNRAYASGGIFNDASYGGSATLSLMNSSVDGNVAYHSENLVAARAAASSTTGR